MTQRLTESPSSARVLPGWRWGGGSLGQQNRFSQLGNAEPRSGQCARRVAILIFPALLYGALPCVFSAYIYTDINVTRDPGHVALETKAPEVA